MPGAETVAHDAAVRATATGRRAGADGEDREPSPRVWPLRVSASDGATAHGGLAREPQAGATDLAARGAESTEETAQASTAQTWLNDGSCIRLRPENKDHVWAYDFVHHRTHDGRAMRLLTIVDEYTRESLAIDVEGTPPGSSTPAPVSGFAARRRIFDRSYPDDCSGVIESVFVLPAPLADIQMSDNWTPGIHRGGEGTSRLGDPVWGRSDSASSLTHAGEEDLAGPGIEPGDPHVEL